MSTSSKLAKILSSLTKASTEKLDEVMASLEQEETSSAQQEPQNVRQLIEMYQRKQKSMKAGEPSSTQPSSKKGKTPAKPKMYCLNFCRYRRAGFSYVRTTTNVQVPGFKDGDTYTEVLEKGARGLGVQHIHNLQFVVSGGIVKNTPLDNGEPWTLGSYVEGIGGQNVRGKKTFGIYVPDSDDESDEEEPPKKKTRLTISKPLHQSTTLHDAWGTSAFPIGVDSDSESDSATTVCLDSGFSAKYCPMECGVVRTSVMALGREGVWRLKNLDFKSSDDDVKAHIDQDCFLLQPEEANEYCLIELQIGNKNILAACNIHGDSVSHSDIKFKVPATLIHSKRKVMMGDSHSSLLCISPHHGKTTYTWERMECGVWTKISVSPNCCLIFVSQPGKYRCLSSLDVFHGNIIFDIERPSCGTNVITEKDLKFEECIGKGSFAVVYRGKWAGKEVALKKMRLPSGIAPESLPNIQEINILRQLDHPNIIKFYGCAKIEDEYVIVMNYIHGANLDNLVFGENKVELSDCDKKYIAGEIGKGVQYLHHHNPVIIHQDLKPQNILITRDLKGVTICDMGVTRIKKAAEATVTSVGKGPGTFPYMAPEMFRKARRGTAVDVYSLGCSFIEFFGSCRVWPNLDATEIMLKVCGSYDNPPSMPDMGHLAEGYQVICSACCQLNGASRPSIDEVLDMIEQLQ